MSTLVYFNACPAKMTSKIFDVLLGFMTIMIISSGCCAETTTPTLFGFLSVLECLLAPSWEQPCNYLQVSQESKIKNFIASRKLGAKL